MSGRNASTADHRQAQARDGTRIAYTVYQQEDSERRAVLVHSLGMDRHFWRPVVDRLVEAAAVLVYDCRGHGESDKPSEGYTIESFAEDLGAVLADVGWGTAAVAGASMGGCVALRFAATNPERTTGLGLIDTTAWYGPSARDNWEQRATQALRSGLRGMIEFQVTRWFSDSFRARHPEVVNRCVETFLRNDVQAFAATCRMLGAFDGRDSLPRVQAPTAIVVGDEDYATPPAMAEALHRSIAGSTLAVIPAVRHLTPLEQPDGVARELLRLLARPTTPQPPGGA